ncbi:uncharacterized protein [Chelonus insularis]|uniref:uncharacterized protein n=1 Tax=Chelonus insularis TaxID=460826 RepID=UPI00158DCB3F|nr:uncharacterized protein LOC118073056 [Chelonus insularis]
MGKGYALIYWINSRHTDTIKCAAIPKKCRKEHAVVTLKWRNGVTGTIERRLAKIVCIAKDKAELNHLSVDTETGILLDKPHKINIRNSISSRSDSLFSARKAAKIKISKQRKQKDGKKNNRAVISHVHDEDSDSSSESSSDDDDDDDDDDDINLINSESIDKSDAMHNLLSNVTLENIQFLKKLVVVMEKVYKKKQNNSKHEEMIMEPDPRAIIDQDKTNIHSSLGAFLPPMTINAVFYRNQDLGDWKKLTTDILVEIYGKQLAFLSAKGRRGAQGIDPNVYRAIYDLVNMRLGWILPSKEFVRHINKVCSNRKKYVRNKDTSQVFVSPLEVEDPIAAEPKYEITPDTDEMPNSYCSIQITETFSEAPM